MKSVILIILAIVVGNIIAALLPLAGKQLGPYIFFGMMGLGLLIATIAIVQIIRGEW